MKFAPTPASRSTSAHAVVSTCARDARLTFKNLIKTNPRTIRVEPARYTARNAESRYFNGFLDDGSFWDHQALSLVILATSDRIRTFRLANRLTYMAEASDRFYMKPLLRAVTHPQSAYILAVSENAVRLVDGAGEVEAQKERVPDMPKDAASAAGKVSINDSGAGELRPCSRTEGYFTPVRERGTK